MYLLISDVICKLCKEKCNEKYVSRHKLKNKLPMFYYDLNHPLSGMVET